MKLPHILHAPPLMKLGEFKSSAGSRLELFLARSPGKSAKISKGIRAGIDRGDVTGSPTGKASAPVFAPEPAIFGLCYCWGECGGGVWACAEGAQV
ncbi:hypothetical protein JTE90_000270 [Oedothorax gibbosus]|uniref:Uncharacterized protein n=1 Tax=Oedothorax gibbosus TaxID=931172 RepID=A0AAV6VRV7_9ARAC|nr:hypothetical protein JTE90_000270 [Oedothorax gibbosus]